MDVFAALADPVRRALLEEIASRPSRVTDLARLHPISRPAISRHLRLLSRAGLVAAEERGRERHYTLAAYAPEALMPVASLLGRLTPSEMPAPLPTHAPLTSHALDALDTEVRRTVRGRRTPDAGTTTHEETA
jgi:DNA-binding transcriptional ArsR family regulator